MAKGKVTYISKTISDIDLLLSLEESNFGHPSLGIATIIRILQAYRNTFPVVDATLLSLARTGKGCQIRQRCNNDPFSDSGAQNRTPCLKLPSSKQILRAVSKSKSKRDVGPKSRDLLDFGASIGS